MPVLLSWAKDDGLFDKMNGKANAGHPYFGPHGVQYFKNHISQTQINSWNESSYQDGPYEFYSTDFVNEIVKFIL